MPSGTGAGRFPSAQVFVRGCRFVVSKMLCRSVSVWMNFRWNTGQVSITSPPDFLPACLAALQAPWLQDGSGLNLGFFLTSFTSFLIFFFFLEGKGLDRNTHWLCLAFSDCPELGILIVKTLHSPVPCFVMWESQGSFPPFLRSCSG